MVADLNVESFASAYAKFIALAAAQLEKRKSRWLRCVRKRRRRISTRDRPACSVFKASEKFPGTGNSRSRFSFASLRLCVSTL